MERDVLWCETEFDVLEQIQELCSECILMPDPNNDENVHIMLNRFKPYVVAPVWNDFSKNLDCTAYWWGGIEDDLWYGSILDHILATRTFLENFNRETGKTGAHCHKVNCNISTSEELGITFKEVSDHCPVTAQMDY